MEVECRECGLLFDVDADRRGERVRCPECGERTEARPPRRREDPPQPDTARTLAIVLGVAAGVLVLALFTCGVLVWYVTSAVGRAADHVAGLADDFRKKAETAAKARLVEDEADALRALREDDPGRRLQGLVFFLGRDVPADAARRRELEAALEPLAKSDDFHVKARAEMLLARLRGR